MSRTLRWVFILLPCAPGLTLLLAGLVWMAATSTPPAAEREAARRQALFAAGGAVLLAGLGIGGLVAWRLAHPRPDPTEGEQENPPVG